MQIRNELEEPPWNGMRFFFYEKEDNSEIFIYFYVKTKEKNANGLPRILNIKPPNVLLVLINDESSSNLKSGCNQPIIWSPFIEP